MATIKISQLPPPPNGTGSGTPQGTDLVPATDTTDTTSAASGTTKKYTQSSILNFYLEAQGLTTYAAVRVGTTTALTVTYSNGASGVGATLTNAGTQAALAIDGVTLSVSDRVLVKNQAAQLQNGIYTVTSVGSGATNWVMTRATDYDQTADIVQYGVVLVNQGTVNAGLLYQETAAAPITIGTDAITFVAYSASYASGSVASITGTANQVLANGTTATPQTGAVTLTLPQSIATSSTPVFAGATLGDLNFSGNTIITTSTNENLFINPNGTGHTIFDTATEFASSVSIQVASVSSNADLVLGTFSATQAQASVYYMYKSHSTTVGSFSAVSNGDIAGLITARGDDGAAFQNVASIAFNVSGSVSAGIVPGQITMSTVNTSGVLTQALAISNAQAATFAASITAATSITATAGIVTSGASTGGFAGKFLAYSTTSSLGSVSLTAANNAGNFANVLTNASTAAARTWTLPDETGTIALANSPSSGYVLLNPTGAQTITTYGLTVPNLTTANLSFDVTANSILSTGTNAPIALTPNGTGGVCIGNSTSTHGTPGSLWIARNGDAPALGLSSYVASTSGCVEYFFKSRSTTQSAFATVNTGDIIGSFIYLGDDGTQFSSAASMYVQATGTISTGIVPGQMVWSTTNSSGVLTIGMTLTSAQILNLANALPPASGGTGTATPPSAGQIPIGTSGNVYTPAAINSGSGIVVANGSGSITVSATGGGIGWTTISGTTQAAAVNTGYIALNSGQTTVTLPAVYAVGDVVRLVGATANTGGWVLTASAGDTIRVNNATTSAGGTVTCTAVAGQCIEVVCDVANSSWVMTSTSSVLLTTA